MEQLNRVELRGIIGAVRFFKVGNKNVANFSVATSTAYRGQDGSIIEETTWHGVTAHEGVNCSDISRLKKGCKVYVIGRLRNIRYTAADSFDRYITEIIANQLDIIED